MPIVATIDGHAAADDERAVEACRTQPGRKPDCGERSGAPAPAPAASPIATEASAMMPATEMSISRAMIRSAIGSATIAFSVKLKVASERFQMSRK